MNAAKATGTKTSRGRATKPTTDELEMFSRVRRASLILDELQRESLEALDLTFVDYSALRVIDMEGPPYRLSPSAMAERLVRTTGGMTKIVDRLERRGLVERERDDVDRRSVQVVLTPDGRALARKASAAYTETRKRVLDLIDRDGIAAINHHLDVLLDALRMALPDDD